MLTESEHKILNNFFSKMMLRSFSTLGFIKDSKTRVGVGPENFLNFKMSVFWRLILTKPGFEYLFIS